jgi:hypothetical protein
MAQHDAEQRVPSRLQQRWAGVGGAGNGENRKKGQFAVRSKGNSCCQEVGEEIMVAIKSVPVSGTTKKGKETKHGPRKGSKTAGDHSNSLKVR